jgi:hypothetical protein
MTVKTSAQLLTELAEGFREKLPYNETFNTRLVALLTNIIDSIATGATLSGLHISGEGVPVDYTDGDPVATGTDVSLPGGLYTDTTNANVYRNDGTTAEPIWVLLADAV